MLLHVDHVDHAHAVTRPAIVRPYAAVVTEPNVVTAQAIQKKLDHANMHVFGMKLAADPTSVPSDMLRELIAASERELGRR